jgi:hypothetical protein
MSMYTTLLGSALDQRDRSGRGTAVGDLFAELLRCRTQLAASGILSPRQARTLGDVTSQLEYDVSLISLARGLGIDFAIGQFDNGERHLLEQVLIERGLPLGGFDERG